MVGFLLFFFLPICVCFVCKDFRKQVNYEVDQRFHVSTKGLEHGGIPDVRPGDTQGALGFSFGSQAGTECPHWRQSEVLKYLFEHLTANPGWARGIQRGPGILSLSRYLAELRKPH